MRAWSFVVVKLLVLLVLILAAEPLPAQPPTKDAGDDAIQNVINEVDKTCRERPVYMLGPEKARRVAELVRRSKPEVVVECGTAIGYSGLWIARELKRLGRGRLITIEISPETAKEAQVNFRRAGLEKYVTVKVGDARTIAKELEGPIDFLFLDCGYSNYEPVFLAVEKKLRPGAVVVADNVGLGSQSMDGYLKYVRAKHQSCTETFEVDLPWAKRDALEVTVVK